ncbi:hypothetical protein OU426_02320 [Frigidibacter sp. RF13]|uniref:hypothetical protein n=1 Tax=Frigidibacter sp. RF13 TaxID=2997340 RepID=UPI00226EE6B1|nr:hypothetical protein [Frigidibacter sp. RF13]MCY1125677.1 hypothetical protein [Frigidibacter sp. RF13]
MVDMLTSVQPLAGLPMHVRPARPQTTEAIKPSDGSGTARNDADQRSPRERTRDWLEGLPRVIGPEPPTGPPPAFEANVLEAEARERKNLARAAEKAAERAANQQRVADDRSVEATAKADREKAKAAAAETTSPPPNDWRATDEPAPARVDKQV